MTKSEYRHKDGKGSLFKNQYKKLDTHADLNGKAVIEGVAGSFDAILYALQQTGKANQNFELEEIKDVHGYDAAWIARNEHLMCDWSLKLVGDTAAHAAIPR